MTMVADAIARIDARKTRRDRRLRVFYTCIASIALLWLTVPPVLSAIASAMTPQSDAATLMTMASQIVRNPIASLRAYKAINAFESTRTHTESQCDRFIAESTDWTTAISPISTIVRAKRAICYDVVGSRQDALAEGQRFVDEAAMTPAGFATMSNLRYAAYMTLILEAASEKRFDLADDFVAAGSHFRITYPGRFETIGDFFSRRSEELNDRLAASDAQRCQPQRLRGAMPFYTYLCYRRGYISKNERSIVIK